MHTNKVPLVLWSGGFDSTLVVMDFLSKGVDIEVIYINLVNNSPKVSREKEAIRNMVRYFNQNRDYFTGRILKQYESTLEYKGDHPKFPQPVLWMTAALGSINPERHSEVVVSYVKGDDASVMKTEIANMADAMQRTQMREPVPLRFPLLEKMMNKENVINTYDSSAQYRMAYQMATCCEYSAPRIDCNCVPCLTHRKALVASNLRPYPTSDIINLYLDIDDVLNTVGLDSQIQAIQEQVQDKLGVSRDCYSEEVCDSVVEFCKEENICIFFRKRSKMDLGSFVSLEKLENLRMLIRSLGTKYHKVNIVGVSSWFNGRNTKEISEFLGIHIDEVGSTGGGETRSEGIRKHQSENPGHSLIIDDIPEEKAKWRSYGLEKYRPHIDGSIGLDEAALERAYRVVDAQLNIAIY